MRIPIAFYKSEKFGTLIEEPIPLGRQLFATSSEYEETIPKVKKAYETLINEAKNGRLQEALDRFLRNISTFAILDSSFKECFAKELGNVNIGQIEDALLSTRYIAERLEYIKHNFRKKKENAVDYAECFGEIVSLLGFEKALKLLRKNGLKIGKSTLQALYKVSMMPTWLKRRIGVDIPLTIAFELPNDVDDEVINRIAGQKYEEAKRILRELKKSVTE